MTVNTIEIGQITAHNIHVSHPKKKYAKESVTIPLLLIIPLLILEVTDTDLRLIYFPVVSPLVLAYRCFQKRRLFTTEYTEYRQCSVCTAVQAV